MGDLVQAESSSEPFPAVLACLVYSMYLCNINTCLHMKNVDYYS